MEAGIYVETKLSDEPQLRLGTRLRRRGPRHAFSAAASILASTVAVAAIVAWLAFCREPQGPRKAVRPVQRHLSENEEGDELNRVLEGCLQLREELGLQGIGSEPDEEPEAKKARLFSALLESATAFERARAGLLHGLQTRTPGTSYQFPAHQQSQLVEGSGSALVQLPRADATGYEERARLPDAFQGMGSAPRHPNDDGYVHPFRAPLMRDPSQTLMTSSSFSHQEWDVRTGWDAQQGTEYRFQQGSQEEEATGKEPQYVGGSPSQGGGEFLASTSGGTSGTEDEGFLPDSWILEYLGDTEEWGHGFGNRESPEDTAKRMRLAGPALDTSVAHGPVFPGESFISSGGNAGGAAPGTSADAWQFVPKHAARHQVQQVATAATGDPKQAEGVLPDLDDPEFGGISDLMFPKHIIERKVPEEIIHLHPFVRLPQAPSERVTYVFDGLQALRSKLCGGAPMRNFHSMRLLFSQPSLTIAGVAHLMIDCKGLITYACKNLTRRPSKNNPYYLARRLASLFMVFDQLVSAIELLGDNMDAPRWWPQFVELFDTDYTFKPKKRIQCHTIGLASLTQRLSGLLNIYKKGIRPPYRDIIQVKRMIFTSLKGNCIFDHPLWKSYMEDDDTFCRIGGTLEK